MRTGVLTGKPEPAKGFDETFYYIKSCTGRIKEPADKVYNVISCFGDNITARKKPEWVAVSKSGKAIRRNRNHRFLWDCICPSVEEYKLKILDLVNDALKSEVTGIHLESIGFPRIEYCICDRCTENYKESNLDWIEWRTKVVNDLIVEASRQVKEKEKSFSVTILPDPCFGKERYGEDFQVLAKYVDFFIVPIYDMAYSTTYWLETLAFDFSKQLQKPFYVELYASDPGPKIKNILAAIVAVSNYADGVILATHDPCLTKKIQETILNDEEAIKFLQRQNCKKMMDIIENWKKLFN